MKQSKIYVALSILLSFATATHSQTPESIDLGLSVEWAATNLDASAPEDFGGYLVGLTQAAWKQRWMYLTSLETGCRICMEGRNPRLKLAAQNLI